MTTIRKLLVELGLEASDYNAGLDNAELKAKSTASSIEQSFSTIGAGLTKTGTIMSAAITAPIAGAFYSAINAASDLEESTNKVLVVFEESATQVLEFANGSASAMGLTEQAVLEAAGAYGNLFTAVGLSEEASAQMSTELVQLSADLASFNNLDPTDVLDKLRAGLTGETEPLKQLGVNINAAMVEAKAMEMGLIGVGEQLTPAAKLQATYALLLQQTEKAQDDFSRTSDGLANTMRITKARLGDVAATLGEHLLPIALKVLEGISGLLGWFEQLSPTGQKVILIVMAIAAAIGPLLVVIGTLLSAVGSIAAFFSGPLIGAIGGVISAAAPILLIIAAVIAAVLLLKTAWDNNFMGIRDTLTAFWENSLKPVFNAIKDWFEVAIPKAIDFLSGVWEDVLLPVFTAVWSFISTILIPAFLAIADLIGAVITTVVTIAAGIWQNVLLPALMAVWSFIATLLQPVFDAVAEVINEEVIPAAESVAEWFNNEVAPAIDNVASVISNVIDWIHDLADKLRNISLPEWMTPGSPTPWEIGLRGVATMLRKVSAVELPKLAASFEMHPEFSQMMIGAPMQPAPMAPIVTLPRNLAATKNDDLIATLQEIAGQHIDEKRLARSIRDAILAVQ